MTIKGFKYPPLLMALLDLRCSAIPEFNLSGKIVEVESKLRDIGFVEKSIEKLQEFAIELKPDEQSGKLAQVHQNPSEVVLKQRWIFLNFERTLSVYFSEDAISIKTTEYVSQDEFYHSTEKILRCIVDVFPSLTKGILTRIGTRYFNLIVPKEGQDVSDYIAKDLFPNSQIPKGLNFKLGLHNRLTMNYLTDHGNLRIDINKFSPQPDQTISIIPRELSDTPEAALSINERPWWNKQLNNNSECVVLDIDLVNQLRIIFSVDEIMQKLQEMRSITKPTFETCITSFARQHWVETE
jgi:uncharacterized protein (TIGR04255 family)